MARLRDELDLLQAAISRVTEVSGIARDHVEKDFWLTECLRGLTSYGAQHNLSILFKGGTSLSKASQLIRRVFEDADMVIVFPQPSRRLRDIHLKAFVHAVELATGLNAVNDDNVAETGATRVASLSYPGGSATLTGPDLNGPRGPGHQRLALP